jgi:competence protein ComEA
MDWMKKLKGGIPGSNEGIDLNKATREQLAKIEGVGPTLADKIVSYREQHGEISADDLQRIEGMGERTAERTRREAKT